MENAIYIVKLCFYFNPTRSSGQDRAPEQSLEDFTEGFAGCPAGGPAGCSFANLRGAAAGNGIDIAEEPGDGVKEPPGLVDAHRRSHLPVFIITMVVYFILPGQGDTFVSLSSMSGIVNGCHGAIDGVSPIMIQRNGRRFLRVNNMGYFSSEAARAGRYREILHARLARPVRETFGRTFLSWSGSNILVIIAPLLLMVLAQYLPIIAAGVIPFTGPGGVMTTFTLNLVHIIMKLVLIIPIMTWFYLLTGKIYLGSLVSALLVTWMFASSQVIAPIPI